VELDELSTVLNDLDYLLDLLDAALVCMLDVREEELEEILAHFVINNSFTGDLLLLN